MISFVSLLWGIKMKGVEDYSLYCKLNIVGIFCMLEFFPLMFLYIKSLVYKNFFGWKDLLILFPGIFTVGAVGLLYIFMGQNDAAAYIREVITTNGHSEVYTAQIYQLYYFFSYSLYHIFLLLQILFVAVYTILYYIRRRKQLNKLSFFSKPTPSYLFETILIALCLSMVFARIIEIQPALPYADSSLHSILWMLALAIVLYYLGYQISRIESSTDGYAKVWPLQDKAISEKNKAIKWENQVKVKARNKETEEDSLHKGYIKLLPEFVRLMEEDKIFLQKHLRLDDVANLLNTNRTYVSFLVKEEFRCGFSEYINRKRIAYVEELVRCEPNLSQEQVADKCGFTYSSSFSRIFKQYTGMTFREWQKNNP